MDNWFESENVKKTVSLITSVLLHFFIFIVVLFWPSLIFNVPKNEMEGIMVVFGDVAEASQTEEDVKEYSKENKVEETTPPKKTANNKEKVKKEKSEKQTKAKYEKTLTEDNNIVLEENKSKKKKTEKVEKTVDAKSQFSKLFKSRGTKKSSKNGAQGDPLGSRDSDILEGITRGKGRAGDGLQSRGMVFEPLIEDNSQKSGRVVVRICVDETGKVTSSKYTQRGSTTTDSELISIAEKNALKYRFSPSNKKEQCGTISIEFIVK